MQVVRRLCDSVTVLDAGRIIASGETADVLNRDEVLRAYLARQSGR
jgi:ABC-type branched-subunit amino acid transport system ATPase component